MIRAGFAQPKEPCYLMTDPDPFALSLSKCQRPSQQGFDKLSQNGTAIRTTLPHASEP